MAKQREEIELWTIQKGETPITTLYRLSHVKNLGKKLSGGHRDLSMKKNLRRVIGGIEGHKDVVIRIEQDEHENYSAKVYTKD